MRAPRVYVAGSSLEPLRAKAAAEALRALGVEVPHEWWEQVLAVGPQNDGRAGQQACKDWAMGDLMAVQRADAVLFLPNADHACLGMHVELGFALAHSVPVVTSGLGRGSIFYSLVHTVVDNDVDAAFVAGALATRRFREDRGLPPT